MVISWIGGTGGIGKTALALHWAHTVADRFPDGQLYVNLRGYDPSGMPLSPAEAIRGFLDALGVPASQIPVSEGAQSGRYRSLLAGRKMLILLDNARDPAQVRPLLPAAVGSLVVVTSRSSLAGLAAADGAVQVPLGLLTEEEARQLLSARLGAERLADEPAAVTALIRLCARLPLALAITASHAAANPALSLADLADSMAAEDDLLDALDTGDAATSIRAVFSWSYRQLTPPAARMFRLVGIHPGPDITAAAAASLAASTPTEARRLLAELTAASLLTEHVAGRYAFHDLLRAYAAEQANETETRDDYRAAIGRALDHYLHSANSASMHLYAERHLELDPPLAGTQPEVFSDWQQALAWFEAEHQVLLAALQRTNEPSAKRQAIQILATVADGAAIGRVPLPQARAWAQEAVDHAADDSDPTMWMSVIWELAFVEAMMGIDPGPRLGVLSSFGPPDQLPVHDWADRIRAVRAIWRGDVRVADDLLTELLRSARQRKEEWSCAIFILHQFELAIRVGDWLRVVRLRDELKASTALHSFDIVTGRADAFVAAANGDIPAVARSMREIEKAISQLGPPRPMWHVWEARRAAGLAALLMSEPQKAAVVLADVHGEVTACGYRDPGTFPLGPDLIEVLALSGQLDEARSILAELQEAATAQEHPWALAGATRARAVIASAAGDDAAAATELESAAAQYQRLQLPFDEARSLLALGSARRRMGQDATARMLLTDAAERLEQLGCPPLAARARDELARIVKAQEREPTWLSRSQLCAIEPAAWPGGLLPARPWPACEGDRPEPTALPLC